MSAYRTIGPLVSYFCSKHRSRVDDIEVVLTSTHDLCFGENIRKMYTPVNLSFTIQKWDVRGCKLRKRLCMMEKKRELFFLLSFTRNYVISFRKGFLFLLVLGIGCVILVRYSLCLPYSYCANNKGVFIYKKKNV